MPPKIRALIRLRKRTRDRLLQLHPSLKAVVFKLQPRRIVVEWVLVEERCEAFFHRQNVGTGKPEPSPDEVRVFRTAILAPLRPGQGLQLEMEVRHSKLENGFRDYDHTVDDVGLVISVTTRDC